MIHFDQSAPNINIAPEVEAHLDKFYGEARALLPEAPESVEVYLDNRYLITEEGIGGYAAGPHTMCISFDVDFPRRPEQLTSLRGTVFHQAFHLVQGHVAQQATATYDTALDNAIYEGAAIVFARKYAGSNPAWGDYSGVPATTLSAWRSVLEQTSIYQYVTSRTMWHEWSSASDHDEESWRAYRVGTQLIDNYLAQIGCDVRDIRGVPASTILHALFPGN